VAGEEEEACELAVALMGAGGEVSHRTRKRELKTGEGGAKLRSLREAELVSSRSNHHSR